VVYKAASTASHEPIGFAEGALRTLEEGGEGKLREPNEHQAGH